ncbi:MAG: hypothetical protein K9W44_09705 [Candidatus Lokiarchaeota archaeon]|nr:hypothetical protein [Candidatus Harpocratesius repetitus]
MYWNNVLHSNEIPEWMKVDVYVNSGYTYIRVSGLYPVNLSSSLLFIFSLLF